MATFALRDVDPFAITICKKGANRQRIFLRKEHVDVDVVLPAATPLRKADGDWSTFYCVVATPGAEEDPGLIGTPGDTDVWASSDEIRKAAHRLLKNGAYVNANHDEDAHPDCHIVESAVALVDFDVVDPTGVAQSIKKDSWYVAIEPSADMREKVENGEITGVSLEGSGVRMAIEKGDPKAQGTKGTDRDHHQAHRTCKSCGAKMALGASKCQSCGATYVKKAQVETEGQVGVLRKLWRAAFPGDPEPVLLRKAPDTFNDKIALQDLRDGLWQGWDALQQVIREATADDDVDDPKAVIRQSIEEFNAWLLGKLDAAGTSGGQGALAKELATVAPEGDPQEDDVDEAQVKQIISEETAALKKAQDDTLAAVQALTAKLDAAPAGGSSGGGEKVTLEKAVDQLGKLADAVDTIDGQLSGLAKSIEELGATSSQDGGSDTQAVRKSDPLAGLLVG